MKKLVVSLLVLLSMAACTKGGSSSGSAPRVVNLAIWSNYITPEVLQNFEKFHGIKVNVSNYSSNEELLAKLQAGASGYDVVVPSDYMVFAMQKLGLLLDLDRNKIKMWNQIAATFMDLPFDRGNKVSVPYDWGTTGIAVNRTLYKGQVPGYKALLTDPALAGKFTLLDDPRETIGAALRALGKSLNSKDPKDLEAAKMLLKGALKRVKGFTSEPKMPLVSGETAVAHIYVSDALQARKEAQGKIEYIYPEEGGTLWFDNLVIPKTAPHPNEAHELIDFLLEPHTSLVTVSSIFVSPVVSGVRDLLPPELRNDAGMFPSEAIRKRSEMMTDLGDSLKMYDRIWTEVKAGAK